MADQEIVFHYPTRRLGGTETLLVRLTRALLARGVATAVVDHCDGYLALNTDQGVRRIDVDRARSGLRPGSVVITSLATVDALRTLDPGSPVVVWSLHPENVTLALPRYRFGRMLGPAPWAQRLAHPIGLSAVRHALSDLHSLGGLAFMDRSNLDFVENLLAPGLRDPMLWPVPVDSPLESPPARPEGDVRIAWMGRIADDKWHALDRLVRDLSHVDRPTAVHLTVVGDGPRSGDLRELVRHHGIEASFTGEVTPDRITEVLTGHHGVVAMGTSLLEAARLGIPALSADAPDEPLPAGLPYRWVDELTGFDLGRVVSRRRPPCTGRPLAAAIAELTDPVAWEGRARAGLAHASGHAVDRLVDRVVTGAAETGATVGDALALTSPFTTWHRIASARRSAKRWVELLKPFDPSPDIG
jgi:glycosyltransferase involved in cell wall biosynthesis